MLVSTLPLFEEEDPYAHDVDWSLPVWCWFDLNTNTDVVTNTPPTYSSIQYVLEGKARKLRVVPA